jgi:hypothetical protein
MMGKALSSGILAGLVAGVPIGLLLTAVVPTDVRLPELSLMAFIASAIGTRSLALAWVVTLAVSALLGAVFGGLVSRAREAGTVASAALGFGLVSWAIVSMIVAPLMIGARPVVDLMQGRLWPLVVGGLMIHLLFVSVLAVVVLWLRSRGRRAEISQPHELRPAA